jgi:hypothetical protein
LVHSFVLEPDSIASRYLRVPKLDRRTKAGKERYAELEAQAAARGLTMIDEETWSKATAIKDSVYRHRTAAALLGKGEAEQAQIRQAAEERGLSMSALLRIASLQLVGGRIVLYSFQRR